MSHIHAQTPHLYVLEGQVDEFDVRGAVILGQETAIVWDTLSHPRDMQPALPILGGRHTTVIYSHADWDHIWGTSALSYGEVIAHRACQERFSTDVPQYLQERQRDEPSVWDDVVLVPPTVTFDSQMNVSVGDMTLELHHLPGHTLDCCVGFIPELGVLLAGDVVETPLPVINEGSPIGFWLAQLERWAHDERVITVIPSHGPIGDRSLIQRNIDYIKGLRDGSASSLLPTRLSEFYARTHQQNQRIAQETT
jgi:glyoxylase-like metal-dependent hydrolase (beta-lactamase superfamily II)